MGRQNRVVSSDLVGVLIAPPLSVVPSRATEPLVDSSLHAVLITRGHPQRGLVVLEMGGLHPMNQVGLLADVFVPCCRAVSGASA